MRRLLPTVLTTIFGLIPLLAGCSTGGRAEDSPASVETARPDTPETLSELVVKAPLELRMLSLLVSRTGYTPSQVAGVDIAAEGVRVRAGGMAWWQRETIRIDHGPEVFSGSLKIEPELSREIPTELLSAWVVSLTDEEFRSQVSYPWAGNDGENLNPRLDLQVTLKKIPPRGDGPVVELVGIESGEFEVVDSNPILDFLLSKYAVRFRVVYLEFEPVAEKRLPRVSDVNAVTCLFAAPIRLQVQVIASTSGRWQPDRDTSTPSLVWASDEDSDLLTIGRYGPGGRRSIGIPPEVFPEMLRWPVSEYQILVRCEPEAGGDWRVPEDLKPGKTVVVGTVSRDRILEAVSDAQAGSSGAGR